MVILLQNISIFPRRGKPGAEDIHLTVGRFYVSFSR
jgi:hypothetical protein